MHISQKGVQLKSEYRFIVILQYADFYGVTGVSIREIWALILVNIHLDSTDMQRIITK